MILCDNMLRHNNQTAHRVTSLTLQ